MARPVRKFWGWGFEGDDVPADEAAAVRNRFGQLFGDLHAPLPVPTAADIELRAPRVRVPAALKCVTDAHVDRVTHSYGQSYADIARAFLRTFPAPPDLVAWPADAAELVRVLDWADAQRVAVIPFGGGTSVCGGVEPLADERFAGTISLDLTRMDQVLEIDRVSRAARIQAGARGPRFDAALKPEGLTLRHFPQSYTMATLGGMIVTRSGGHYATGPTHIDEFVEAVTMVTPRGDIATRRLPASGAGPDPLRLVCGSEGILGIVTEAWMRVQARPRHRAGRSVEFDGLAPAVDAVRDIAQSGLQPANCRLLDPFEALANGVGDGVTALVVLGFESADHPQDAALARAVEIATAHGGRPQADPAAGHGRDARSDAWKRAFVRMPYWREILVPHGVIVDTFESACTWSDFESFHAGLVADVQRAIQSATRAPGFVSCRFTHLYADGPAPYYTFVCRSEPTRMLDAWRDIKAAINASVVSHGGTATHHHAVGRDHRPGAYDHERPDLYADALRGAKRALDPNGVLNPGVLIDA